MPFGFAHLGTVRSEDQALCGTLCVWFRCVDNTDIIQETMPETGIDHMSCNMFHTAVVPVNRHPVFHLLAVCKSFCIVWIHITKEIPGRSSPLWHGISLSLGIAAAFRAFAVYEGIDLCKWRLSVLTWLEILDLRQTKRKLLIWNRYVTALWTMNDRDWLPQYL